MNANSVMKTIRTLCFYILLLSVKPLVAQISPPGLGVANTAGWMAFGIRQELDTLKKKQSVTYIGMGRKSNPDNYNPYYKSAILVLNQEIYNQFHKHWQYSLALSYRRQNEYEKQSPYEQENPGIKQEFRVYGRYSYILKTSRYKFAATYRQEFRRFYTPGFTPMEELFQLRSRLRVQLALNLNAQKTRRLVLSSEALFSISQEQTAGHHYWTSFGYRESRFCAYYSVSPKELPFTFNAGYMYNLIGLDAPTSVHYLALDVIWEDPFKIGRKQKPKVEEYLE